MYRLSNQIGQIYCCLQLQVASRSHLSALSANRTVWAAHDKPSPPLCRFDICFFHQKSNTYAIESRSLCAYFDNSKPKYLNYLLISLVLARVRQNGYSLILARVRQNSYSLSQPPLKHQSQSSSRCDNYNNTRLFSIRQSCPSLTLTYATILLSFVLFSHSCYYYPASSTFPQTSNLLLLWTGSL